jgi:hypothetical protein
VPAGLGLHRREEFARPGDMPLALGVVLGRGRVDVHVVGGVALATSTAFGGLPRDRGSTRSRMDKAKRGEPRTALSSRAE